MGRGKAIWIGISCLCMSCAGAVEKHPVSIGLEIDENARIWRDSVQKVNQKLTQYEVVEVDSGRDTRILNHIAYRDGKAEVCLAPRTIYNQVGELERFVPLMCVQLEEKKPVTSLKKAIQRADRRVVKPSKGMSELAFRQAVLEMSTPADPVCYGVFPDLFASYMGEISVSLLESYLIACASRIDGDGGMVPSHQLAQWLMESAALLSTNSLFIQRAFVMAASDGTYEGRSYGSALEAHVEMLSHRIRQAEVTSLVSLAQSDLSRNDFVSRQNIERIHYGLVNSDTMTGERLETIVRAIAPTHDYMSPFQQLRQIVQIRACQMSIAVPETKPSLASACLPWLKYSLRHIDEFKSVLALVGYGIDNAGQGEDPIAPDVLDWLRTFSTDNPEIETERRVFLKRFGL